MGYLLYLMFRCYRRCDGCDGNFGNFVGTKHTRYHYELGGALASLCSVKTFMNLQDFLGVESLILEPDLEKATMDST